jgi:hypothetical protein
MMSLPVRTDEAVTMKDDLSRIALQAAMELDLIKRRQATSREHVNRLTERLNRDTGLGTNPAKISQLAPITAEVLARSIGAYSKSNVSSFDELAAQLKELLNRFDKLDEIDDNSIGGLMRFCVTLHDEIFSRRRAVESERRPRSPYRV